MFLVSFIMSESGGDVSGIYPYNDIYLDSIVLALYAAPTNAPYHQETADVTRLPDPRRNVFHPDL